MLIFPSDEKPEIELKQANDGVYYFHNYVPVRRFNYRSDEEVEMSKKIWKYKEEDQDAFKFFTNELMVAITLLSKKFFDKNIGLVAVPPSKVDKYSPIRKSIKTIEWWYENGMAESKFGCHKKIYDYSTLLTRTTDIVTSHEGRRATYDEQHDSIYCSRNNLWKYHTAFIILDDVTTKGTSMKVCKDILVEHESNENHIYCLAIAKTI